MTATCWLITSGSYSDYQVHAVCPTKAAAEATIAADEAARRGHPRGNGDDFHIGEVPFLDGNEPLAVYAGWWASGYVTASGIAEPTITATERPINDVKDYLLGDGSRRWVQAGGSDPDRVRKAYFDRATMVQASMAGP